MLSPVAASCVFGAADWKKYFGDVGAEPPLPTDINKILEGPCPFWPGKKVYETHLLTLIPATVKGKPFTLDYLGNLIPCPKEGGKATQYFSYPRGMQTKYGNESEESHWVLMTRDVLEGTRGKNYSAQRPIVEGYLNYKAPRVSEAATVILMKYVETGSRLYSDDPWTYTHCPGEDGQSLTVGGFVASGGLRLGLSNGRVNNNIGLAAVRRFYGSAQPITTCFPLSGGRF